MFDVLVESNRRGRRDVRGTILGMFSSTAFQVVLVTAAVYATMGVAKQAEEVKIDTIQMTLDQPKEQPKKPEEQQPVVTSLAPPPKGFQVVTAPVDIPTEIPPDMPISLL